MRIIAGTAKGHTINAPRGMRTRPTQDQVREAVFNVVAAWGLEDTRVLDVYAGTGAMAIEALSRGARAAVAIDRATTRCILQNAVHCRVQDRLTVLSLSAQAGLQRLAATHALPFDYVFMDPPYGKGLILPVLERLAAYSLLRPKAYVAVEHADTEQVAWPTVFVVVKEKQYRHTCMTYLQYTAGENVDADSSLFREF